MLCDEIAADGAPGSGSDVRVVLPRLRAAQKFVLGPEFAAVAEALAEDFGGLVRVFDRCRLPFVQTWIEVCQHDRPRFMASGVQAPRYQVAPKRIGYLLSATRDDLSAWKAHLFWSLADGRGCSAAAVAMRFDMTGELCHEVDVPSYDDSSRLRSEVVPNVEQHPGWAAADKATRLMLINHTKPALPDWGLPATLDLPPEKWLEYYEIVTELARSDWAGEATYLLAVVGLLNARNAVEAEAVSHGKLNKARARRGKPPLFEHKVLKIHHRQQRRYGGEGSGTHAPAREHFVRAHWKVRRSGVFLWSPHLRGDASRGRVEKSYELVR